MVTDIVVPVRGRLDLTMALVEQLEEQSGWRYCLILDNGSEDGTESYLRDLGEDDRVFLHSRWPYDGIYDLWSKGFQWARIGGADAVLFLNNDILLSPALILRLSTVLEHHPEAGIAYPDYELSHEVDTIEWAAVEQTRGTYRHGGMSGYCFLLRTAAVTWPDPFIDPIFQWWGGDDDIAFNVERAGWTQLRALGHGITHYGESTAIQHPEKAAMKAADLSAVFSKWGR